MAVFLVAIAVVWAITLVATLTVASGWCPTAAISVVQLLTPWWTVLSFLGVVIALAVAQWWLASTGLVVVAVALVVLWPKLHRSRRQGGPSTCHDGFSLALANLYTDNPEPDDAVRQLLDLDVDVLVMTELTTELLDRFDDLGGRTRFPERIHRVPLEGEYEAGIFASDGLRDTQVDGSGVLRTVRATIGVGAQKCQIVAAHPVAPVGGDGFGDWRKQLAALRTTLTRAHGPTIVIGDLNSATLQPPYERLLTTPFRDAHSEMGEALRPSWGVAPWLPRWIPTLVARLDHLLVSPEIEIARLEDLDPVGSDHRPFRAELCIAS